MAQSEYGPRYCPECDALYNPVTHRADHDSMCPLGKFGPDWEYVKTMLEEYDRRTEEIG